MDDTLYLERASPSRWRSTDIRSVNFISISFILILSLKMGPNYKYLNRFKLRSFTVWFKTNHLVFSFRICSLQKSWDAVTTIVGIEVVLDDHITPKYLVLFESDRGILRSRKLA
jgi:hypothetical protein